MAAIGAVLVVEAVVYAIGVPWLIATTGMPADKAVAVAMLPFLVPDMMKAFAAVVIATAVERALPRVGVAQAFRFARLVDVRLLGDRRQHDGHARAAAGRFAASMRPPCAVMIARTIASPSPAPPLARVRLESAR